MIPMDRHHQLKTLRNAYLDAWAKQAFEWWGDKKFRFGIRSLLMFFVVFALVFAVDHALRKRFVDIETRRLVKQKKFFSPETTSTDGPFFVEITLWQGSSSESFGYNGVMGFYAKFYESHSLGGLRPEVEDEIRERIMEELRTSRDLQNRHP